MLSRVDTGLARQCIFSVTVFTHNLDPLLACGDVAASLKQLLADKARKFRCSVLGYVFMPDHFHALLAFDRAGALSEFMQELLSTSTRQLHPDGRELWRHTYEAVLITSEEDFYRKLQDVHSNPVRRELCDNPACWEHSSASVWMNGTDDGLTSTSLDRTNIRWRKTREVLEEKKTQEE